MPNWCNTTIDFIGPDSKRLYEDIKKWCVNTMEQDFGEMWLGNICLNSGIVKDVSADNCPRCRGWIEHIEYLEQPKQCHIQTETAWVPMIRMWEMILEKGKYDVKLLYSAEEPGCELYWSNDPQYVNSYIIEFCINELEDYQTLYDIHEEDAFEFLTEIAGKKNIEISSSDTVNSLTDKIEKTLGENEYLIINKYRYMKNEEDGC